MRNLLGDATGLRAAANSGIDGVVAHLAQLSDGWLPEVAATATLEDLLCKRVVAWAADERDRLGGPVLYPVVHDGAIRVTARVFCEVTDAAFEAARAGAEVILVGLPLGRAARRDNTTRRLDQFAAAWRCIGLPVRAAGDVSELEGVAQHLVEAARQNAFTRRARDLPDLFTAAAAAALGIDTVYLGQGCGFGHSLRGRGVLGSLGRLYGADPFAAPPPSGKRRPAGSDSLWELAFTAELTDRIQLGLEREAAGRAVRERLARGWNTLRRVQMTAHYPLAAPDVVPIELQLTATSATEFDHMPVILPLFGSPVIAPTTGALIEYVASAVGGELVTVVVDDLNPRYLYSNYDFAAVQGRWRTAASQVGCHLEFLSDRDPQQLAIDITVVFGQLTGEDLHAVLPAGRLNRARGGATGYDAVHLATMAVAACRDQPVVVAVRAANLTAVERFTRHSQIRGILVLSGLDGPRVPAGAKFVRPLDRHWGSTSS
ncbi:MAG: hypothetical protein ACRDTD_08955 [Pseudonocardiaceae bacterium]